MPTELFSNDANTTLNGAITNVATSLVVASAAKFPVLAAGEQFRIRVEDATGSGVNLEYMIVTATTGTTFTITRAQEGTAAVAHTSGSAVALVLTAEGLSATGVSLTPASSTRNVVQPTAVSSVPLVVKGTALQAANLQEWQNSTGAAVASVEPGGSIHSPYVKVDAGGSVLTDYISDRTVTAGTLDFGQTAGAAIRAFSRSASRVALVVQGAVSQTANLQEWQNSANAVLAKINSAGFLTSGRVTLADNNGASFPAVSSGSAALEVQGSQQGATGQLRLGNPTGGIFLGALLDAPYGLNVQPSGSTGFGGALTMYDGNAGTLLSVATTTGGMVLKTTSAAAIPALDVQNGAPAKISTIVRGAAVQTASLQEWWNSAGTAQALVDPTGGMEIITAGKGLKLKSPDGLTTKTVTINNAGALTLL